MQTDVLDVQARASVADMLLCVFKAPLKLSDSQKVKVTIANKLLSAWDFRFNKDSSAASIFFAWEYQLAYHLHEKKITNPVVRVALNYNAPNNQFTWI